MADNDKNKFGGLFGSLKKMVFTEDYLDQHIEVTNEANSSNENNVTTPVNTGIITTNIANDDMVAKIYNLLESINKPGVDFFELWNAAEAMGGPTAVNLQNAFTSFKVLGLDKNVVVQTGEAYVVELQSKLGADIQRKSAEKESLELKLKTEKQQLQTAKQSLETQIQQLNAQLADTTNQLNKIDTSYQTEMQEIDQKIAMGKNALNTVVGQINNVIQTVKVNIN